MSSVTVIDGGMGKELRRIGAPFRQPEWSALALMEAPERVVEAHSNFIDAGAQVIITNNYAVVPYHLGDDVVEARGGDLIALAGRLAREAADGAGREVRVAGSLPPLFGSYEPEHFDAERAAPHYRRIVDALDPSVDLWVGETFSRVDELDAILDATDGTDKPVWVGFALPDEFEGDRIALRSGETVGDIVEAVAARPGRVAAVLFNCSLPERTGPAIAELAGLVAQRDLDVAIGGYANAFPTSKQTGYSANEVVLERRADLTAERYADEVAGWVAAGATIVGGCCDMYPEHIAALAARFG